MREVEHIHVATRSVPLPDHKVSSRIVIPRHIEVPASIVVEVDIRVVIGPVLNRVDAVLAGLERAFRRGSSNDGSEEATGKSEGPHYGNDEKISAVDEDELTR
jgi:hypothetical protein